MLKKIVAQVVIGGALIITGCNIALAWNPMGPFFH
jgi:hypothetical protein